MTEPKAPTPQEATPYYPGGDMTEGVARAHIETTEEIAANPIDDEPVRVCEACLGSGTDLDEACPSTDSGQHVLNFEVSENDVLEEDKAKHEIIDAALYGEPVVADPYKNQHAKVLRFELSVGKNDDERTIEALEADIREALKKINGTSLHNVTTLGGHYLIDGKVCLPQDYDPTTKNRKPGTFPPSWAGGPVKGKEHEYEAEHQTEHTPVKKSDRRRKEVTANDSPEDAVTKLAGNMNQEVKAK